jgi:hypothetical protein
MAGKNGMLKVLEKTINNDPMRKARFSLVAATAACLLAGFPAANAAVSVSASVGGAPIGVSRVSFDSLTLGSGGGIASGPIGSVTVSFLSDGQAVQGTSEPLFAAPWLSGGNGNGFGPLGSNQTDGQDATTYLTSGLSTDANHGQAILTFSSPQRYIGLLWGSVDSFNTLSLYSGGESGTLVANVTGTQVLASPNGDQGLNGSVYVNINSDTFFDTIVATSTQYAFEFDNVAYNPEPVPEPATCALLLFAFGLHGLRRLRNWTCWSLAKIS